MRRSHGEWVRFGILLSLAVVPLLRQTSSAFADTSPDSTLDEQLARIGEDVPTFGGMYIEDGTMYVWLTDHGETLHTAVDSIGDLTTDRNLPIVALEAEYSFVELKVWSDLMTPVLGLDGVVWTDIDERANRLSVGIDPGTARNVVLNELKRLDIPVMAVLIVETDGVSTLPEEGLRVGALAVAAVILALSALALLVVRSSRRSSTAGDLRRTRTGLSR